MSRPDYRDLVIEDLADSEAALCDSERRLRDRIVALELEVRVWREIAQQGIHCLHDREMQNGRLRESQRLLREELRGRCLKGGR